MLQPEGADVTHHQPISLMRKLRLGDLVHIYRASYQDGNAYSGVQSLCSQPPPYAIIQINSDPTADFHNAVTYPSLSRSISANVWEGSAGGGSRSAILKLRGNVGGLVHERMKQGGR